jgi:phosphoesterase RecJ-like protein
MTQKVVHLIETGACMRMLRDAGRIVLTTHTNPDGDALGSECALYTALVAMKKDVRIVNCDAAPENLAFLAAHATFETYDAAEHDPVIAAADLLVALDFNDARRVRGMEQPFRDAPGRRLVIDHHLDPKPFADAYCSIPDSSSTAEIIYDLLDGDNVALPYETALGLYVGIMTDSGMFRFERTTPRLHRIAARLLEAGVDPMSIHRSIFDDYPMGRTQLFGLILAGIEQYCEGQVTLLTVTSAMFAQTGTTIEDVENVVNSGLAIRGVEATALLTERDGEIKLSFRSRGAIAVNTIAGQFGGGGHRLASGATVTGVPLDELKRRVADALCDAIRRG